MKPKPEPLSPAEFVTAWIEAFKAKMTVQQLAEQLQRPSTELRRRKRFYQKRGVNLPELVDNKASGFPPINAQELNELMKGLL